MHWHKSLTSFNPAAIMQTTIKRKAIALAIILGISLSSPAQTVTLTPIPPDAVPDTGIFCSMSGNLPPSPFNPFPQLPLYTDGTPGNYWFDDRDFDYPAYWAQASAAANLSHSGGIAMDDFPALPGDGGDGGGGTNSSGGGVSLPDASFPTNGLWLQITGITNDIVSVALNNTTNQVYAIWSSTDLLTWNVETEVWPTNTTVMPFTVQTLDRQNLFVQAEDWTGATENGNTTPDWWFWEYFNTLALSDTNLDANGNELLYDYQNGVDPNIINFWLSVAKQCFNTSSATVQISVSAGVPSYMAALVDDTNLADANWTPYNSNIVVNLGSVDGWHTVSVGLRGLPPNAQKTWNPIQLELVLNPPLLVITNPIASIVTQPMIELQGFCPEPLTSLTFDLSNAAGLFTNQQAFVLAQCVDPNTRHFTTNTFQAFDVPLTNGDNVVTFHATDLAGNITTTNFTYTLDYSGKTNPPAIQVFWPQNSDQVSGTEFTLRGALDDFTASLTAQIVDSSGNTNSVQGLVERNGFFWVENVPLLAGTNYVTLTAMDAIGNISTTNLTISVSAGLTIDDFSSELGGSPRNVIPVVTGTISLSSYTLWVNGVQATQDGQGNWNADSVPVGPGGTAVVEARAIPNSDNGDNGTGTAPPSDGTPGNPTSPDSVAAELQIDQPTMVYLQTYDSHGNSLTTDYNDCVQNCPGTRTDSLESQTCWDVMAGGTATEYYTADLAGPCSDYPVYWDNYAYTYPIDFWPPSVAGVCVYTDSEGGDTTNSAPPPDLPRAEWSENDHFVWDIASDRCSESGETDYHLHTTTTMTLQTSGKGAAGRQNLVEIDVSATAYLSFPLPLPDTFNQDWTTQAVPGNEITALGQAANANGQIFVVLSDNATMDITPQAPPQRYTYSLGATKYYSYFTAYDEEPKPGGPRWDIVTVWGFTAGHAWWCLSNGAPPEGLCKAGISYFNQELLNQQVGYFSQIRPASIFDNVPGILRIPGNGERIDAQRQYHIGISDLKSSLSFTAGLAQNPGWYILYSAIGGGAHNCVTTTIQAGAFSGVTLPNDTTPQNFGIHFNAMPNH